MIMVKASRKVSNSEVCNKIKMYREKINEGLNPGKGRKTWKQYFTSCLFCKNTYSTRN